MPELGVEKTMADPSENETTDFMGKVAKRNPDRRRLELVRSWFQEKLGPKYELNVEPPGGGNGFSSQLFFVQAKSHSEYRRFVVRNEVTEDATFPLHDFLQEPAALSAAYQAGIPAPEVCWVESGENCDGGRFYVMNRVDGLVPQDSPHYRVSGWAAEAPEMYKRELWFSGIDALVQLAKCGVSDKGINALVNQTPPAEQFQAEIDRYTRVHAEFTKRQLAGPVDYCLDFIRANQPSSFNYAISWGDARLQNMIFQEGSCVALIDWEMTCVAPPELDLAYMIYCCECEHIHGIPRGNGWPSREETIEYYQRESGINVSETLPYLIAVCALRMFVIAERMQVVGNRTPPMEDIVTYVKRLLDEA